MRKLRVEQGHVLFIPDLSSLNLPDGQAVHSAKLLPEQVKQE